MTSFFEGTRPGHSVEHGSAMFELPLLYFRDDAFMLFFTADFDKVKAAMPSDQLYPVKIFGDRAILGVSASNFLETTVGAYGEVAVFAPAVYGRKPPPMIPFAMEMKYPGFGTVVLHMPVTTISARDVGRGEWGYTKFTSDMHFDINPEYMQCRVSEQNQDILVLRVRRRGVPLRENRPFVSYSVKDNNLIKNTIRQSGAHRTALRPKGCYLTLGDHVVSRSIQEFDISPKPFLSRYYMERSVICPAGDVIERGVRSLEGYRGKNKEGRVTVSYMHEAGS